MCVVGCVLKSIFRMGLGEKTLKLLHSPNESCGSLGVPALFSSGRKVFSLQISKGNLERKGSPPS